jgi:D-alanyl-D-alanine carboxypeptidase/D-alanyl-D-alanine-endopeptidase (penicillin-binding protein 4)
MPARRIVFAILLSVSTVVRADELAEKIEAVTNAPEYKSARWGILVTDTNGKPLYEHDADKLVLPASVTKLYTCATAICELGPDFKFMTPVYRRGEVLGSVLNGDLILVASGDLTFGGRRGKDGKTVFADADHTYANSGLMNSKLPETDPLHALDELAEQVSKTIKEVKGEVLVDDRLFGRSRSSGSGPDIVSCISVNDNVLDLIITPGASQGDPATVKLRPETAFVQMDADVRTGGAMGAVSIDIEATGPAQFMVRGRIPVKSSPIVRIYPVDDPTLWARALFIEALRRKGVKVNASLHRPRRLDMLPGRDESIPRIAEYTSEPLSDVIKVTLKVSHNLYASTLPILVGVKNGNPSPDGGLRRQARLLKGFGVDPLAVSFAGGAGGAPADSVTARATVDLLRGMSKHPAGKEYFDALPILGVDGTLADAVPKESPARGKARAKTGTLVWLDAQNNRHILRSKALAGELETAKGTKLYVAMFLNDMPLPFGGTAAQQGKVLGKLCEVIYKYGP